METLVRTPQLVFMQPQRLIVPLFQRPYVWTQVTQWEPLWEDVTRVATRVLQSPSAQQQPHFLGAVVLQQVSQPTGHLQQRIVIDGQQRLTTLQLLLDALRRELQASGAVAPAARIHALVENAEHFRSEAKERFKVWPTNRDQAAFSRAMSDVATESAAWDGSDNQQVAEAHQYFRAQVREWLSQPGPGRAEAIELTARELLQLVVIDLNANENAQEIFETLNARGTQLTAADLVKNFVFQRLSEAKADVEAIYRAQWRDFETAFWEASVSAGRTIHARSSMFLNHWLMATTGEEVLAREVFDRFKRFASHEAASSMQDLVGRIHRAAGLYRRFVESAAPKSGTVDRLSLFAYRTGVMESEVVKPLVLHLLDPDLPSVSPVQLDKALHTFESWMVRRMLVRATSKANNQLIADLIALLQGDARTNAGDELEGYLAAQDTKTRYWPDDDEVREQLRTLVAYKVIGRGRLRMLLEAIEDHLRGWLAGKQGLGGERVARGAYAIEHIMPRKWETHWPAAADVAQRRSRLVHTIGNLTLLTSKLNSKLSNGPWLGEGGKRGILHAHDVLLLNRRVYDAATDAWTDEMIEERSRLLADAILEIWPAPPGHKTEFGASAPTPRRKLKLTELIAAGVLQAGVPLQPRTKKHQHVQVALLADGSVDVAGKVFDNVSKAASAITGHATNGWWFFLADLEHRRSLRTIRREYLESLFEGGEDEEDDGEDELDDE